MSRVDSKKEFLNTLRTVFGIIVAVILTVTAGLINMYYKSSMDFLFYLGIFLDTILLVCLPIIMKYIIKITKELEEL